MEPLVQSVGGDVSAFAGPAWVTLAYVALYYLFIVNVLRVKLRGHRGARHTGEAFDRYFTRSREMLAADRAQLNMLEHMPVFLILMWVHALLVSAFEATMLGAVYTGTRALYPMLVGRRMGRDVPVRLLPITFTGYGILLAFGIRIGMVLLAG